MISIHTFELTLDVTSKNFNDLLSRAYQKAKKYKHRLGKSTKHTANDVRVDDALASEGITVEYHNNTYRKMVKLLVNPSKVLGEMILSSGYPMLPMSRSSSIGWMTMWKSTLKRTIPWMISY